MVSGFIIIIYTVSGFIIIIYTVYWLHELGLANHAACRLALRSAVLECIVIIYIYTVSGLISIIIYTVSARIMIDG